MKIVDLAEVMIKELAPGYGNKDIEIEIIGIRPGEKKKIYELLMTEEEAEYAEDWEDMFVLKPGIFTPHYINKKVTSQSQPIPVEEYKVSSNAKLLTKKEIKAFLSGQERTIFDNRTQMNADNQDFKLNFGTKPEVKRKAFDNLRK